jgi:hypothetical protein
VQFPKSIQLKQQFWDAQFTLDPVASPTNWVHNVPTRWSSDQQMAERALKHREALDVLFTKVRKQWEHTGSKESENPDLLQYQLTDQEWRVVAALQLVLKPFTIGNRQLQGNPATSHSRATTGRFDEYYPVIEVLLDHLERTLRHNLIEQY